MPGLALRDRFESFLRLLADTNEFIDEMPEYRKRDGAAVIYAFNSLFDIAWKLMKDSLSEFYGLADVKPSPRDVIKQSGAVGLISDQELWLAMLRNRNLSTHDYMSVNQEHYCELVKREYLPLMDALEATIAGQIAEMDAE
ncbi:HI0074 family nucleotidyltransferase substrate-binding subunit [Adlercreutzia sp. R21]|uniref:HI0074 family nucleotidyltransferase substrate-binding subunit n=1 Tax=Adlercreutzia wanghongyangiae TaxID=3111451 RepID=UPI002DBB2665|nr:HI0074 family nucleotidyltransferase substrate-binding subunit [Adlercreutzia sp. R21]MEC4183457.1 HI0074 family nucleotidyltransferase substrate-binding subunit [Adlercreutzia sp. R21]